jgi:polyhydroxybutyrate depolymerase
VNWTARPFLKLALLLAAILLSSCANASQGDLALRYDGVTRTYNYYEPSNLAPGAPLVFALHGYQGTAKDLQDSFGLDKVADANGFAVAYPQGLEDFGGFNHWNARLGLSDIDDIGFLTALAEQLQDEHGLDPDRTYISGFSNGGFMSYVLATEAPETFQGAASIMGTMSRHTWENRDLRPPFPLLQISAVDDGVILFDGNTDPKSRWGGAPGLETIIDYWTERSICQTENSASLSDNATIVRHTNCETGNHIWFVRIEDFGHELPTASSGAGFDSAQTMWEFFSQLGQR